MRDEVKRNGRIEDDAAPLQYDDFFAYMRQGKYIFIPTRELWPAKSVDARLSQRDKLKPHAWLDENRAVTQLTWAPGEPQLIKNRVIDNGGFIDDEGSRIFNSYRAPPDPHDLPAGNVTRWLRHHVNGLMLGGMEATSRDVVSMSSPDDISKRRQTDVATKRKRASMPASALEPDREAGLPTAYLACIAPMQVLDLRPAASSNLK